MTSIRGSGRTGRTGAQWRGRSASTRAGRIARLGLAAIFALAGAVRAEPWIEPGDPWLKHDIQRLADAGIITSPVSAWPLSWGDIAQDVLNPGVAEEIDPDVVTALGRVQRLARRAIDFGDPQYEIGITLAEEPQLIRAFEDVPRGDIEAWGSLAWTGERFAMKLRASYVDDPIDDQEIRPDGSYIAMALGNWMVGASYLDRWWGPGWGGSLILSNSARPIPALVLERNFSTPFETKWLSWIGPWSMSVIWGVLDDDRAVEDTRFFGWRINFRPLDDLEIGLLRTAQWCGEGRPCDLDTFLKVLTGRGTNLDEGVDPSEEAGNQLAGFDLRWESPVGELPYAVYGQFIGEDEAGGFPSKYLGQLGVEIWGRSERFELDYRAYLEYADTTCRFEASDPDFNCAYNNSFYPTGYRYENRPIGYATDNDARTVTAGLVVREDEGRDWHLVARHSELNRGGAPDPANAVTATAQDFMDVQVSHKRQFGTADLELGVGVERFEDLVTDQTETNVRAFARFSVRF